MKFLQLVIRPGDGSSMWGAGVRLGTIKWTVGQEETQVSKGMSVSGTRRRNPSSVLNSQHPGMVKCGHLYWKLDRGPHHQEVRRRYSEDVRCWNVSGHFIQFFLIGTPCSLWLWLAGASLECIPDTFKICYYELPLSIHHYVSVSQVP